MPGSELDQKVRRKSELLRNGPKAGDPRSPQGLKSTPLINQLLSTSTQPNTGGGGTTTTTDFSVKSPPSGGKHHHHQYHYTNLIPSRTSNHGIIPPYSDFLEIPEQTFAQQLTRMDYVRHSTNITIANEISFDYFRNSSSGSSPTSASALSGPAGTRAATATRPPLWPLWSNSTPSPTGSYLPS